MLLRDLRVTPGADCGKLLYSFDGKEGTDSLGSAKNAASDGEAATGVDKRREASPEEGSVGNISFSVAVLARDGRGGGAAMPLVDFECEME